MKNGFTALVASAVVCSMAFASPGLTESNVMGLNSTEHSTLFGEGSTVQAVALDSAEMSATEGKFGFKIGKFKIKLFEQRTVEVIKDNKSIWHTDIIPIYSNTGSHAYSQSTQNQ